MKRASGRHPLEIKSVAKSYDDLKVIKTFTAAISRGEKIALTGRNGTGKTTLLKSLIRNATGFIEDADQKFPRRWRQGEMGPRSLRRLFRAGSPRFRRQRSNRHRMAAWQFDPQASQEELRGLLGQMLFSGEDALKPTKALSGGEIGAA